MVTARGRRLASALLLVALLAACEDDFRPPLVKSPDGTAWWYDIQCRGGRGGCMNQAAALCVHGYDVMDASEGGGTVQGLRSGAVYTAHIDRADEMFVKCRHPAGR